MSHRIARVNRTGLALLGLVLTMAGAAALARGLGLLGPAHMPVITEELRAYTSSRSWFWPALAVAALVVELAALRWLVLQARTERIRHLDMEPDLHHGITRLSAGAATEALENELTGGPRAERVHAAFTGAPSAPRLKVNVTIPEEADPAASTRRVHQALTRLRQALETERLPAMIRIRTVRTHR